MSNKKQVKGWLIVDKNGKIGSNMLDDIATNKKWRALQTARQWGEGHTAIPCVITYVLPSKTNPN